MSLSFYEVVVIGDELAGAVAGAHLARRGFRVLMLCSAPVERDLLGEYAVPRSPLLLTGLESPALKRVVAELNLLQLLRRRVEPNHPAFQVLLPEHRLDISAGDLPSELHRELPDESAAWDAYATAAAAVSATLEKLVVQDLTLPPDGFWDRRDAKRIAAQLPSEMPLPDGAISPISILQLPPQARMIAALTARFGSDLDEPGDIAHARIGELHRQGTFNFDGGREGLRALLLDRIKTYAGEVRHDLPVRGLVMKRGRAVGVAVGNRDEQVGCGQVICAMSAAEVVQLLPDAPPRRLAEAAAVPAAFHRYRLHLIAPLEALPDALGRFVFSVRKVDAPLSDENAIAIHVGHGHGQHAVLSVEALCSDATRLTELRAGLRAHLDAIFPFLDRHVLATWSPHDGLLPEGRGARDKSGAPLTVALEGPVAMDPVWAIPRPRTLGFCGLPHATGVKQVFLASRQVLPGLGFEGELATGWGAARLVVQKASRKEIRVGQLLSG